MPRSRSGDTNELRKRKSLDAKPLLHPFNIYYEPFNCLACVSCPCKEIQKSTRFSQPSIMEVSINEISILVYIYQPTFLSHFFTAINFPSRQSHPPDFHLLEGQPQSCLQINHFLLSSLISFFYFMSLHPFFSCINHSPISLYIYFVSSLPSPSSRSHLLYHFFIICPIFQPSIPRFPYSSLINSFIPL